MPIRKFITWALAGAVFYPLAAAAGAAKSGAVQMTPTLAITAAIQGGVGGGLLAAIRPWMVQTELRFWLGWGCVSLALAVIGSSAAVIVFKDFSVKASMLAFTVTMILFGFIDKWFSKPNE